MRELWTAAVVICLAGMAHGQIDCTKTAYQDNNMTDYGPLVVRSLAGVTEDNRRSRIPGVCVAVFTDNSEHRMVAATQSGNDGRYALPALPQGKYRVIATYDSLCAANVPVVMSRKAKALTLHVVMEARGIDACSYGELK